MGAVVLAASAATNAAAAAAAARARQAKISACRATMREYQDNGATIGERQAYASCVKLVYPEPAGSPGDVLFTKALIVAAMVGLIIGAWQGWRIERNVFLSGLMSAAGAVLLPLALLLGALAIFAIGYLAG
jgi:hypothetical protein